MRKYILSLISLAFSMSINAQVIKVYKNGETTPVKTYINTATDKYKFVFEEAPNFSAGNFSVSSTKTVQFAKSNIYWDGSVFRFEDNQTDFPDSWKDNHVGHFFWSKTAAASYAESYNDGTCTISDVPFFAESKGGLTVEGTTGLYALSSAEWSYLLDKRNYTNRYALAKVNGVNGLLIFPDSYNGNVKVSGTGITSVEHDIDAYFPEESIPSETWAAMESAGVVFLPAAYHRDSSTFETDNDGYYWSSTCQEDEEGTAFALNFFSTNVAPESDANRYYGCSLRLVKSNSTTIVPVTSVSLNKTATSILMGANETLIASILPENAYNKNVIWSSSDEDVAIVDATGKVSVPSSAREGARATITATTMDGGKTATCEVTAVKTHEYVDLGLTSGTLWATCNLGSETPEGSGMFFAWGETTGYGSDTSDGRSFDWGSYKWMTEGQSSEFQINKYTIDDRSSKGIWYTETNAFIGDGKHRLDAIDDAATANWGYDWCMPSVEQQKELLSETSYVWTTCNGINGYRVTSKKNGNSIFLPAAGRREDGNLNKNTEYGHYWTSDIGEYHSYHAEQMFFAEWMHGITYPTSNSRCDGLSVRAVRSVRATSLSLNKTSMTMEQCSKEALTATFVPENTTYKTLTWSSSDENVATVDANGMVKVPFSAKVGSTATITVISEDRSMIATCVVTVKKADANFLPGEFSVSSDKRVLFTKSNVYWDGSDLRFEDKQTDFPESWDPDHVGHFYWTKTVAPAYASTYTETSTNRDVPFFGESAGGLTVEGTPGLYALNSAEWSYLLHDRKCTNRHARATVNGVRGLLIFPDNYNDNNIVSGTGIAEVNSYSCLFPKVSIPSETWAAMEADGVVFLPAAGYRNDDSGIYKCADYGFYHSSTHNFSKDDVGVIAITMDRVRCENSRCNMGSSLRLVR